MKFDVTIHVHHHYDVNIVGQLGDIQSRLQDIITQGKNIMSHVEAAEAAIAKIDAATTKQGEQLAEIANLTQEVSDDIDAIIAAMPEGMPEDFVAKLQALADRSQSVSDSLDAHATFSKNIAAKWPVNPPVPTPVPDIPDPVDE